jgi:hypothetical protein
VSLQRGNQEQRLPFKGGTRSSGCYSKGEPGAEVALQRGSQEQRLPFKAGNRNRDFNYILIYLQTGQKSTILGI